MLDLSMFLSVVGASKSLSFKIRTRINGRVHSDSRLVGNGEAHQHENPSENEKTEENSRLNELRRGSLDPREFSQIKSPALEVRRGSVDPAALARGWTRKRAVFQPQCPPILPHSEEVGGTTDLSGKKEDFFLISKAK